MIAASSLRPVTRGTPVAALALGPADGAGAAETRPPSLSEIASLVIQIGKAAWQVAQEGDERQTEKACQTLAETRRALYRILAQDSEQQETDA